jgi:ParB-like chromosome segregation protein Spo0J
VAVIMPPDRVRPLRLGSGEGAEDDGIVSSSLALTPAAPPYQLLPQLTGDEYAALKADIAEHGIRVPIDVDEQGRILDGHHRSTIAAELGIDPPKRVITGLTEEAKREHALAVNVQRRILTREQRRSLIANELTRDGSRSDREIGRLLGCDHKTVGAVRRELAGEIPHYRVERVLNERDYSPYRPHHLLDIIPLVPADQFAGTAVSIREQGLLFPITLSHDRTVIVDGRIRYLACRLVHVEPRFTVLGPEYDDDEKAWGYICAENFLRVSLTQDERETIFAEFEKLRDARLASNDPEVGPSSQLIDSGGAG